MTRVRGAVFLGLALVAPSILPAAEPKAYSVLGDVAVMDQGRIKPLSSLAISKVKSIYSRSEITLTNPETGTTTKWGPVAAWLDWTARPEFWNQQDFIFVDNLELKRKLLAKPIKAELAAMAAQPTTSAADKAVLEAIAALPEPGEADLERTTSLTSLSEANAKAIDRRIKQLVGDRNYKWVSPNDIENTEISEHGDVHSFGDWFMELFGKRESSGGAKLPLLEEKAIEVGIRFITYQAARDHNTQRVPSLELAILPRPSSAEYLAHIGNAYKNYEKADGRIVGLTPLETDSIRLLNAYMQLIQAEDRALPGSGNSRFDERFSQWLRERAEWVPLRVVLDTDLDELKTAGFPATKVEALRAALKDLEATEVTSPGALPIEKAQALSVAARELGEALGNYPSKVAMARESHYNDFAPFYRAPMAFGLATVLLLLSLGITADPKSLMGRFDKGLYGLGMLGFIAGIGLVIYGFSLRIQITGWAPVTNMEESVIWVAMMTASLGLVLELIYRRKFAALAGSGIALITTVLAANVSFLDPQIKALQPVLRSNYWLTIHVLTIVSSYAAFALALGLGLLALGYYLTATYRRTATYRELARPLLPGLPLAALGTAGVLATYQDGWLPSWIDPAPTFYAAWALFYLGWVPCVAAVYALVSEFANRKPAAAGVLGLVPLAVGALGATLALIGQGPRWLALYEAQFASWSIAMVGLSWLLLSFFGAQARQILRGSAKQAAAGLLESDAEPDSAPEPAFAELGEAAAGGTAVATRPRSKIAAIRASQADYTQRPPQRDERTLAMQATAGRIKPLATFVYRAMQVGVLLVAAGTILGGVWADYSWGRFWGWDPKEVWALITLLVYLVPLHGRFAGWVNTFGLVVASVVCFCSVLMAWYGVNFVLGVGLHSYGFVEGGGQGIVMFTTVSVLAIVGAAIWRRRVSSAPPAVGSVVAGG